MDRIVVRRNAYFDSVFLMSISAEVRRVAGIEAGQAVLGTPANVELLMAQGFDLAPHGALGPTDLVVTLRASMLQALDAAEAKLAELMTRRTAAGAGTGEQRPAGLDGALRAQPGSNLVVISVPGPYAAYEARKALLAGVHVMLFSDNVPVEQEIALKEEALRRNLLLMGPDCGTAIINGAMLGFANKVRRGGIGVIGASGTGMQEVTCLIDRAGEGISQAIGTGGRDLREKVGARGTLFAMDVLAADPLTKVMVVISKPPAPAVAEKVLAKLRGLDKPSVVHFVGSGAWRTEGRITHTPDLESTAAAACALAHGRTPVWEQPSLPAELIARERQGKSVTQKYIRGLFTGGTMAAEALAWLAPRLGRVVSNLGHEGVSPKPGQPGHMVVDLGDDEFTRGRPHPMIDPTPRAEWLAADAEDPGVAVILMDVVLGTGSHADPAGQMVEPIRRARERAASHGRSLSFVASVTGTDGDRQGLAGQVASLRSAGVVVLPSNIQAVRFAHAVVEGAHV